MSVALQPWTGDFFGNISVEISPLGNKTYHLYDFCGNLLKTVFPNKIIYSYEYDRNGNVVGCGTIDGLYTYMVYDDYGRCIEKRQVDQSKICCPTSKERIERWEYDGLLLTSYSNARGIATYYSYDEFGRKISERYDKREKLFIYDCMGNLCVEKEDDLESSFSFDVEGRLIETSKNGFHLMTYEYDIEGRKSCVHKLTSKGLARACP